MIINASGGNADAVMTVAQTLSDTQKTQARTNIGALSSANGAVAAKNLASNAVETAKIKDGAITRAKLAQDALYSPVVAASAGKNIQISDIDTTFYATWTSAGSVRTWTLNQELSRALPIGFIVGFTELWANDKTRVSLSGIRAIHEGDGQFLDKTKSAVIGLAERGSMIVLQKMSADNNNGDVWLISGNMEVVS